MKFTFMLSGLMVFSAAGFLPVHAQNAVFKGASYESLRKTGNDGFVSSVENGALKRISNSSDSRVPSVTTAAVAERALNPGNMQGRQLFNYLHEQTETSGIQSYDAARNFMYSKADNTLYNGKKGIETFYSQIFVSGSSGDGDDYREQGDLNKDGVVDKMINAEHLWPQSFFGKQRPMVSDLHHLRPTFETPNGRRSALPFGKVNSAQYQTSSGSKMGNGVFEPCDQSKGDVARSMLYFIVRYHDKNIKAGGFNRANFINNRIEMFLEWNRMDPPDAEEIRRNDLIEGFQGNRNPFIDDHTLADKIGAEAFKL